MLYNCVVATNAAYSYGGGAYQITLKKCTVLGNDCLSYGGGVANGQMENCTLTANSTRSSTGGGAAFSGLRNCLVSTNFAPTDSSGVASGTLVNCTIVGNVTTNYSPSSGGAGVSDAALTNCIVWGNTMAVTNHTRNYKNCTLVYSCSTPLAAGAGNMDSDPQLHSDGLHLGVTSPCRGAGTNGIASGYDLDGDAWASPPSIGCDEWKPEPVIVAQPAASFAGKVRTALYSLEVAGQPPFTCFWNKDGTLLAESPHHGSANSTDLLIRGLGPEDSGSYQVVVSNVSGMATSQVSALLIRCVDAAGATPFAPYTNWLTAATNVQDAIDAADPGDVILVTNGVYAGGGRVMEGGLTNRAALYKPVAVLSVNGPAVTTIRGQWDPVSTNGPAAVRCVWMTNKTALNGFTVMGGATTGPTGVSSWGGGVMAQADSVVANCLIVSNSAASFGGGLWLGKVYGCAVIHNQSVLGSGGGGWGGTYVNSTIAWNYARFNAGGLYSGYATNCVIYHNTALAGVTYPNALISIMQNCCTTSWGTGANNIADDPQLVDAFHLAVTSPCRGMGSALFSTGADLDGEDWLNPPSIGCDEVLEANLTGPLAVAVEATADTVLVNRTLGVTGRVTGRAARLEWSFGDGPAVTNVSYITSHVWTNAGDYTVTCTAFNADNPLGVTASLLVHVLPVDPPVVTGAGLTGTNFQLQFTGQATANYWVEYATNLTPPITWQTVKSLTSTGGVEQVTDSSATNDARFYRIRAQ